MTCYRNIRKLMRENNMDSSQLAASIGVETETVDNWLNGTEFIPLSSLRDISLLFGTRADQLLKL